MKWSYSMNGVMRRCQRQFGYSYLVASHSSEGRRREAYVLKQLQSMSAWQGHVVHEVLATQFRDDLVARRGVRVDELTSAALSLAQSQLAFSAARRFREPGQTKGAAGDAYCALFEHEYSRPTPKDPAQRVAATAHSCFENLAGQASLMALLQSGSGFESEVTLQGRFDGMPVSATIDLTFTTSNGRRVIIDWKIAASETSEYALQLLVYGLVATQSRNWPGLVATGIDLFEANLMRNTVRGVEINDGTIAEAEDFMLRSVSEARDLEMVASEEDLSGLALAGSPNSCAYCNFNRMCVEDLQRAGRSQEAQAVQGHLWA